MDEPISKSAVDALPRHDWDWDGMGEMPDGGYFAVADVVALHDALAAENERLRDALALVLAWHDKDKHTAGQMTLERSNAFAKARAAMAPIGGMK